MTTIAQHAKRVADAYGPSFTKAMMDGDLKPFQELFINDEPVSVVLQNAAGQEVHFTVGDQDDATLTWAEFHTTCTKDIKAQKYAKSVAECLGVLGDQFIMEVGRINQAGDVYMEAFSLVTLTPEGKISMLEAFSDVNASGLLEAAVQGSE